MLLSIGAILLSAAGVQTDQAAPEEPTYYICSATRDGAFGHITASMDVPVDGSPAFHRMNWEMPRRAEGLSLRVQWYGRGADGSGLNDRAWVFLRFTTARSFRGEARIEFRRTPGARYASEFAFAGPFARRRALDSSTFYFESEARWGEIEAWMDGVEFLTVALVGRDGRVHAQDRLDAAALGLADAAVAALRPELDAMADAYRERCEVPQDIIVT